MGLTSFSSKAAIVIVVAAVIAVHAGLVQPVQRVVVDHAEPRVVRAGVKGRSFCRTKRQKVQSTDENTPCVQYYELGAPQCVCTWGGKQKYVAM